MTIPALLGEQPDEIKLESFSIHGEGLAPRVTFTVVEGVYLLDAEGEPMPNRAGHPAWRRAAGGRRWTFVIDTNDQAALAEIAAMQARIAGRVQQQFAEGRFDAYEAQAAEAPGLVARYLAGELPWLIVSGPSA